MKLTPVEVWNCSIRCWELFPSEGYCSDFCTYICAHVILMYRNEGSILRHSNENKLTNFKEFRTVESPDEFDRLVVQQTFSFTYRYCKLESLSRSKVSSPVSRLLDRSIFCRFFSFSISVGIAPLKEFLLRSLYNR